MGKALREAWEVRKLWEVCDFQRGLTYSKKDEVDFSENIVLRSGNIDLHTNKLIFTDLKYINPKIIIPENKKVTKDSLIICTANGSKSHLGKVALIDEDYGYAFGGFMGLIKPRENLNSAFLFYLMTSDAYKKFVDALSDGANINNLKFGDLGNFAIPLPSLPEQQKIVAILDEAFGAIEKAKTNAKRNLTHAKELFESYLQSVFENKSEDWKTIKINEICESIIDCINKTATVTIEETPFKMIRTTNIRFGKVDLSLVRCVSEEIYEQWTRRQKPMYGDILFTREAPMGEVGMLLSNDNVFLGQRIVSYRIDKTQADNNFILYAFQSADIKNQIYSLASGATVQHLRVPHTKSFIFSIPSLTEQQTIVKKLDTLSEQTKALEKIYQQKINDLDELKKSILQKAFNGELT